MSEQYTNTDEIHNTDAKDGKSAKKFLFILMLIPIGLGVGVFLSNINFRKQEDEKAQLEQFKVSQVFDKADIEDDMKKIAASAGEGTDYFLRHISSTLGINNYLTRRPTDDTNSIIGYYDIKGEDEKVITAVIVELNEQNPVANSALLAIPTAVIKSLNGEKGFSHTLRFIFLPKEHKGNQLNLKVKGEVVKSHFIIRAGGDFTLDDEIAWKSDNNVLQHSAMTYPHESLRDSITAGRVELALQAARQLKVILELEMQK